MSRPISGRFFDSERLGVAHDAFLTAWAALEARGDIRTLRGVRDQTRLHLAKSILQGASDEHRTPQELAEAVLKHFNHPAARKHSHAVGAQG